MRIDVPWIESAMLDSWGVPGALSTSAGTGSSPG
jgi:hypothetical protein